MGIDLLSIAVEYIEALSAGEYARTSGVEPAADPAEIAQRFDAALADRIRQVVAED